MNPPTMAGWNLALRFTLELAAVAGIATAAWRTTDGPWRWLTTIVLPVLAIAAWGVFNVPDDPSRSGNAPIEVPGAVRLAVELAVLGAGAAGFLWRGPRWVGVTMLALVVVHYATTIDRLRWLIDQ